MCEQVDVSALVEDDEEEVTLSGLAERIEGKVESAVNTAADALDSLEAAETDSENPGEDADEAALQATCEKLAVEAANALDEAEQELIVALANVQVARDWLNEEYDFGLEDEPEG